MPYRLLVLDVDGTLIDSSLEIKDASVTLLRKVRDKGIIVTLATGRMFPSAQAIATKLGIDIPLIVYNGAQIRHSITGGFILDKPVPLEAAKRIIRFSQANNLYLQLYQNDVIVVEKMVQETLIDPDLAFAACREVGDLSAIDLIPPPKMMIVTAPDKVAGLMSEIKALLGADINITQSKPYLIELLHREVSKGKALQALAESYQIPREETMVIGDNDNDIEMIKWAGFGAAVANSSQNLRDWADYVARHEYSLGVEEIINKYLV